MKHYFTRSCIFLFFFLLLPGWLLYSQQYVLLAWNDLGMHCANQDFSKIAVLPPFNNINAQLILKASGQPPQIVTSGYTLEYSIPGNTYSVGKTNFWTYAQQLFGLSNPLPDNIGLAGKGLTGVLDSAGTYFTAHGIPLTPFQDADLINESPFQLVHVVAKSTSTGDVLATTDAVIPVSNEVGCVQSGCHNSAASILAEHEDVPNFNSSGPVLCASCHASNALGTAGIPEAMPFSYRMHDTHKEAAGPKDSISTCYKCHPGPRTQCLRDIMGKNPKNPLVCQNCHGPLDSVASSILGGRRPWLDEPKCGTCHGSNHAEESGKLFRQSTGHGGLFCSACHGSPHAIQPTIQPNDNLQNSRLQGFAGALRKCSVCHDTPMTNPGPHGLMDTTTIIASIPVLSSPPNGTTGITTSPSLTWHIAVFAQSYRVQVSTDSLFSTLVYNDSTLTATSVSISLLDSLQTYYWHVQSKNDTVHSAWSEVWSFTTGSGSAYTYSMNQYWNLISLPIVVQNSSVSSLFPTAVSSAFSYAPFTGYSSCTTLDACVGYWIKFNEGTLVNLNGTQILSDTIDVSQGWNMIGSISVSVTVTNIISDPGGIVTSDFFAYDNGYGTARTLDPANGYWVKVSQAGKLILSGSTSNSLNRIRIIPTAELPPSPPGENYTTPYTAVPDQFLLEQNYPNPFNPTTNIGFRIAKFGFVTLKIYNTLGEEVAVLVNEEREPGEYSVRWDASMMPSGIYTYRLVAGMYTETRKMLFIK